MRTEDLRAFVVVADTGNFRAAAELLHITQPGLTRRIQKLEALLGVQLMTRSTRRVELTAAGVQFLQKARTIVIDVDSALIDLQEAVSRSHGQLRIGCLPTVGMTLLPTVLDRFTSSNPRISFRILDGNALDVLRMVHARQVDIGLGMKLDSDPELSFTPILEEDIGVICRHDHPVASQTVLRWKDIAEYPFAYNVGESGNWLLIKRHLQNYDVQLNWRHEIQSLQSILMVAKAGNILSVAQGRFIEALGITDLVFRPVAAPAIRRQIMLFEKQDIPRTPHLERFVQMLTEYVAETSIAR